MGRVSEQKEAKPGVGSGFIGRRHSQGLRGTRGPRRMDVDPNPPNVIKMMTMMMIKSTQNSLPYAPKYPPSKKKQRIAGIGRGLVRLQH